MRKFFRNPDSLVLKVGLTILIAIELYKFIRYVATTAVRIAMAHVGEGWLAPAEQRSETGAFGATNRGSLQ